MDFDLKDLIALIERGQRGIAIAEMPTSGGRVHRVDAAIIRANGKVRILPPTLNARVDAGANWLAGITGNAAGTPAKNIAFSTSSLSILKGDTTLTGETAASGLARVAATYGSYTAPSTLNGTATFQFTKTVTNNSGGAVTIQSAAMFDALSGGNMFVEANLSASATLQPGDSLAITWTITI